MGFFWCVFFSFLSNSKQKKPMLSLPGCCFAASGDNVREFILSASNAKAFGVFKDDLYCSVLRALGGLPADASTKAAMKIII